MKGVTNLRILTKLSDKLFGLSSAMLRYPYHSVSGNRICCQHECNLSWAIKWQRTTGMCCRCSVVCCHADGSRKYFSKNRTRILLYLGGLIITAAYYLLLISAPDLSLEISVRTSASLLALLFMHLLIPGFKKVDICLTRFFLFL